MYNTEQVRQDQQHDAARRTLNVRPGFSRDSKAPRKPFVAKGHDAILKSLQDGEQLITITTMGDGTEWTGKMAARDKYTITIQLDSGIRKTFYKHAIESFEPVQVQ